MITKTLLYLFVIIFCFTAKAQLYSFKQFDHTNGLRLSDISAITEDSKGYIWLGSSGGDLIKYDGLNFEVSDYHFDKSNISISSVHFTKNKLHISGLYSGFYTSFNDSLKLTTKQAQDGGSSDYVYSINNTIVKISANLIQLTNNTKTIASFRSYPLYQKIAVYSVTELNNAIIVFTSRGNYFINEQEILPLYDWLNTSKKNVQDYRHAYQSGDSLLFVNKRLDEELTVLISGNTPKFFIKDSLRGSVKLRENEEVTYSQYKNKRSVLITNTGRLFNLKKGIREIFNNSTLSLAHPKGLMIDFNNDIWVLPQLNGLIKISKQTFTKLDLNPVFNQKYICFIHKTEDDRILISDQENKSAIGSMYANKKLKKYDYYFNNLIQFNGLSILGTSRGVKLLEGLNLSPIYEQLPQTDLRIFSANNNEFFFFADRKGGISKCLKNGNIIPQYNNLTSKRFSYIFYTSEYSKQENKIYFGTNAGVFYFDLTRNAWGDVNTFIKKNELGTNCGASTKDAQGNIWITCSQGIVGISPNGDLTKLDDPKYLTNKTFYTINTDSKGNLYLGTDKGITFLELDLNKNIISSKIYNELNGFNGFETHMRSHFQDESNAFFVGTLDGLYYVKTNKINKHSKPRAPIFKNYKNSIAKQSLKPDSVYTFDSENNNVYFNFEVVNTKDLNILYQYKLKGATTDWSLLTSNKEIFFNDLEQGDYKFSVRATFNKKDFSKTSSISFKIYTPFYKTKYFAVLFVMLLIAVNIYILTRTKNYDKKNIILSKDVDVQKRMASTILFFGGIANTSAHIIASRVDSTIPKLDILAVFAGLILMVFGVIIRYSKSNTIAKDLLLIGFVMAIVHNIAGCFYTSLHPFYILGIVLTCSISPYVITRLKHVLIFGILLIITGAVGVVVIDIGVYNKVLFFVAISLAAVLGYFSTYLRNNSLEKLIFTSGVVNKGNLLVTSFNRRGKISYMSENFSDIFDTDYSSYLNEPIASLNNLKTNSTAKTFGDVDLTKDFKEGHIFITPLRSLDNEILYYQWSCKSFGADVNVILGQDITDKISLEKYYELIVTNVDDLIYQCDVNGKFTFINNNCKEATGYEKAELLGKDSISIIQKEFRGNALKHYAKQFSNSIKSTYLEFPIETKDGKTKWFGQNVTTLYKDGSSKIIEGYLSLARDITEKRKADSLIKEQNADITSSINYAKKIQYNLLPSKQRFNSYFPNSFILFKAKDIVSGDFYWLDKIDNKVIILNGDCTGHGVPGSFMTLLGINLLNQIVLENKITDPGEILTILNKKLIETLPRENTNSKNEEIKVNDGMECSICVIDLDTLNMKYATAGAKFGIYKDELEIFRGNMEHIGDNETSIYTTYTYQLTKEHSVYLYSDGFADQFGGPKGKKMTNKRFLNFIKEGIDLPTKEQKSHLYNSLMNWMSDYEQTDDISLISFNFKEKEAKKSDVETEE